MPIVDRREFGAGLLTAVSVALTHADPAAAQTLAARKVALVVGNQSYQAEAGRRPQSNELENLKDPIRDATAMAQVLRSLGFEVDLAVDQKKSDLDRLSRQFRARLRGASVGLFFFSGHGFQTIDVSNARSTNHVVPIDFRLDPGGVLPAGERLATLPLDAVVEALRAEARIGLVFMDACRNDPTIAAAAAASKSGSRNMRMAVGLSDVPVSVNPNAPLAKGPAAGSGPAGLMIVYATDAGNFSYDGAPTETMSPFTKSLTTHLVTPGLALSEVMNRVSADVTDIAQRAGRRQTPWVTSSLNASAYQFVPRAVTAAPAAPAATAVAPAQKKMMILP